MTERKSGYDPETGICWNFNNKGEGENRWRGNHCPACSVEFGEYQLAMFGRCRSGRRWFWAVRQYSEEVAPVYGFENTEELATAAAIHAVRNLKTKPWIKAIFVQGVATDTLKKLNEAKRRARPASSASDAHVVEYLYSREHCYTDGWPCDHEKLTGTERVLYHTVKFQILRKTKKRVYYNRTELPFLDEGGDMAIRVRDGTGYVDRLKLEAEGEVYNRGQHWSAPDSHLYLSVDHLLSRHLRDEDRQPKPDLAALKAEMAAAHPDHGGTNAAFIAARAAYVEARRSVARHQRQRREAAE